MRHERVDGPSREAGGATPGRRGVLATLLALGAAGLARPSKVAIAKKCKKKCPRCKTLCGAGCKGCFTRPDGSPLCANSANLSNAPCLPCESDGHCLGSAFPYCVSAVRELATGEMDPIACPGNPPGRCIEPIGC